MTIVCCPLDVVVIVEVHDDPIVGAFEPVRGGSVGIRGGEIPVATARVQHRQPRLAFGIETLGRDGRQAAGLGLPAIFAIYREQVATAGWLAGAAGGAWSRERIRSSMLARFAR